jgi:two-component system phosphate regulon sensor histidine kinase PhoR
MASLSPYLCIMSNKSLRIFLVFSAIVLSSIIVMQGYWLHKAWQLSDNDFERRVSASLRVVNTRINQLYKLDNNTANPVRRVASNYYVVDIPASINQVILEEYIKREFKRNDIKSDFEYGIYDCSVDHIHYGGYVCTSGKCDENNTVHYKFPGIDQNSYYFGVYFPSVALASGTMNTWILSSAAILVLIVIFCGAIYIVLKQKRLSEIQKDFINNITHEFKTPVSTISLSAEALQNPVIQNSPDRINLYAGIIKQESERLRQHTERILQAGLMSDREKLEIKPLPVNDTIRRLVDNLAPLLTEKGAAIKLILSSDEPVLMTDEFHFTNIIYNLVDNALKYCDEAPVIEVTTIADKHHITVSVRDNGLGIRKEEQKNIFKRFYRVSTGNVHNVRGFGLGLYYVKTILKRLHGEIRVMSGPGHGSDFSIVFNV